MKVGRCGVQVARVGESLGMETNAHELVRLVVWQVAEQYAVDDRADARGGADPDT